MGINYAHLHNITAREIISALIRDGFVLDRQHVRHADGRRVTVTLHSSGDTFTTKTLKTMIEIQACWSEGDLKRLKRFNCLLCVEALIDDTAQHDDQRGKRMISWSRVSRSSGA